MGNLKIYVRAILIPVILGSIVGILISGSMDYEMLQQPLFAPPSWIFPVVWTILYVLMGVSYGRLESKGLADASAKAIYYAQLIANLLWPIVFFVFKWRLFAFFWILLLVGLVIKMIIEFYKRDNLSGLLQIPYQVRLTFAKLKRLISRDK